MQIRYSTVVPVSEWYLRACFFFWSWILLKTTDTVDSDSNGADELSDEGLDVSQRLPDTTLFQQNFDINSEDVMLGKDFYST